MTATVNDIRKLNVCHFVTYYLPVTQNWIYNQLVYNRECESTVLCQRLINPGQFPFDGVFPICQSPGIGSVPARLAHKIFERYPLSPHLSVVKRIGPDVLHGHFLLEPWRNYRLVKRLGIPLVTTCYGQDITSLPRKPFWHGRCRKVFELSAAFIVEGAYMGKTLEALGCPEEKIRVIKLGVDIERITGGRADMPRGRNAGHTGNDKIRILFTGLNREKKGAAYAARAFVKALSLTNKNLELHILGSGVYRRPVEEFLTDAGAMPKTVFHGTLPVGRYLELLRNTDILLAPSVRAADGDTEGGAPVTVIEALCAGTPVVGSDHCDIPNIVKHGASGLLSKERDADALATDIVTLAESRELRISMGDNGARYVRAEHDIEKQTRKITDVYREIL